MSEITFTAADVEEYVNNHSIVICSASSCRGGGYRLRLSYSMGDQVYRVESDDLPLHESADAASALAFYEDHLAHLKRTR